MRYCRIPGCSSQSGTKTGKRRRRIKFFFLPTVLKTHCDQTLALSTKRRKLWLERIDSEAINIAAALNKRIEICEKHFVQGRPSKLVEDSHPDWAPSLRLRSQNGKGKPLSQELRDAYEVPTGSETNKVLFPDLQYAKKPEGASTSQGPPSASLPTTSPTGENVAELSGEGFGMHFMAESAEVESEVEKEIDEENDVPVVNIGACSEDFVEMRASLDDQFYESLKNDDTQVECLTGFPTWSLCKQVFHSIVGDEVVQRRRLTKFQEFIMAMMRLRLGLPVTGLSIRFKIVASTTSRILADWMGELATRLEPLIVWPEQDVLQETMSPCFREMFGNSRVLVIDIVEIFIVVPEGINTITYVLGMTPQGRVCFLARGWKVTANSITLQDELLDRLLPGDTLLSNRGFSVPEELGMCSNTLGVPSFTKGQTKLCRTCDCGMVKSMVRQIVGFVRRKFQILQIKHHFTMCKPRAKTGKQQIDEILKICCALINLCPPIIPPEDVASDQDDSSFSE